MQLEVQKERYNHKLRKNENIQEAVKKFESKIVKNS